MAGIVGVGEAVHGGGGVAEGVGALGHLGYVSCQVVFVEEGFGQEGIVLAGQAVKGVVGIAHGGAGLVRLDNIAVSVVIIGDFGGAVSPDKVDCG